MKASPIIPIFFLWSCLLGTEKPDDQDVWIYSLPEEVGLSDSLLLVLDENIKDEVYSNINSLIVIKEDQLVFENYYDLSFRSRLRSIGEASWPVLITALDLMQRDGFIDGIQQPIVDFLPEYTDLFDQEPEKREITIEHLLSNRSGLGWNQSQALPPNLNDLIQMKNTNDWTEYVLSKPLEAPPGLRYVPNSGSGLVLARIMENAIESDLLEYLNTELFQKIDIHEVVWDTDPAGTYDGGSGVSLLPLDHTKFGYLLLNGGRWKRERIISQEWIFEMTDSRFAVTNSTNSGYGWWQFADGVLAVEENDLFFTYGGQGQQLYVIPHLQMVVTINGENVGQAFFNSSTFIFLAVLASLESNED